MRRNPYWDVQGLEGEDEAAFALRAGQIHFDAQQHENAQWWRRIGTPVDLRDQCVLEIGCGHGALSFEALDRGAARVTGIDLDASRVAFAHRYLCAHRPQQLPSLRFQSLSLGELPQEESFDILLSKDTFEHVLDLAGLLKEAHRRLRTGGLLVFGFSPLYYSPNGDHGRYRLPLPWLHAFLPERLLFRWASYRLQRPIRSAAHVGLNRLTCRELLNMLGPEEWEQLSLRINPIANPLCPVFNLLRRIPPLERYFTIGVYGIFRKRDPEAVPDGAVPDSHRTPAAAPSDPCGTGADEPVRHGPTRCEAAAPK